MYYKFLKKILRAGHLLVASSLFWGEQQPVVAFAAAGCILFRIERIPFFKVGFFDACL
jgi:hypothetical protein